MEIAGTDLVEETAADAALDGFVAALDHLIGVVDDGGLDGFDGLRLVGFLQRFERARNRTALVDHRALRVAGAVRLPETVGQPNLKTVLGWALRLSPAEAGRRVRAAEQVGERVSVTGEHLEPLRPALAAAQRSGHASPEQLDICLRALDRVDHRGFDPADLDAADRLLAQFASTFAPKELHRLAGQVVDQIDPDGTRPRDEVNQDRRHLTLRPTRDGMCTLEGRLTGALGTKLHAVLGPLARPRPQTTVLDAYHHHNFAARGWTCRMIDGLPAWIPPRWVDREQRPLRHARITARQRGQTLRR